jgi:benzoylformate decarboxylase
MSLDAPSRPSRRRATEPFATVRDATYAVLRDRGMTTMFSNPGSTEVPFLGGLPADFEFVLGLHEGSVVGMATGWALARSRPALVLIHTTAGLGNAVGALATARVNRAPLVVVVGQQDRRHLALEPFLAGRLEGLAGTYPVWVNQPVRAQDVPGVVDRAWHEAATHRGPALVIVPMDDWAAEPTADEEQASPRTIVRATAADRAGVRALAGQLEDAESPALVVGAGADDPETRAALVALAERLDAPVWQESFGARAAFPQDHPLFAGHLPADRPRLREALAPHDAVLVVGAPIFRQYPFAPGRLVLEDTRILLITADPEEAHRSPADLALLAPPASACGQLVELLPARERRDRAPRTIDRIPPPASGEPLRAAHVLDALAERLPPEAILVEETPSSRPDLHQRVPAVSYLGFVSAAMGGLGFALPGAIGLRMGAPGRPVVAVVGDGSSLYQIQSLWTAAHYRVGALFLVLQNRGYAVMDHLAQGEGASAVPWPALDGIDLVGLAAALSCPARAVRTYDELVAALDEVLPTLADRDEPLLLDVAVARDPSFQP